ncbi:hypothetical protein [Nonomuraea sp. NPDC048826]|uniref:hypothetical protein n=1 Tax=Nonomuraea sp. NPDC048826 TaxID=3364347 RepID=UPI0037202727
MRAAEMRGRTVIVTGACHVIGHGTGHGVGAAASRALSGAGAAVVLAACGCRASAELAAEVGAVAVLADLANPVSVRRLVEQTLGAFGRLDAAANLGDGMAAVMAYEIAAMRRTGGGRIVNLALTPAVRDLTRAAALEHAGTGIRIDTVEPGPRAAEVVVRLCCAEKFLPPDVVPDVKDGRWAPTDR